MADSTSRYNVLVFGETGVGKSSVVNMLFDKTTAPTSDSVKGCTFKSKAYKGTRRGQKFKIHDTIGLNECDRGTVPAAQAVSKLVKLIRSLEDGLHVAVMVLKQGRIKDVDVKNYKVFISGLCQNKVPLILCFTYCENTEGDMQDWYEEEMDEIDDLGIHCKAGVCITTIRDGPLAAVPFIRKRYRESRKLLGNTILEVALDTPWKMTSIYDWIVAFFRSAWNTLASWLRFDSIVPLNDLFYNIFVELGFDARTAVKESNQLHKEIEDEN